MSTRNDKGGAFAYAISGGRSKSWNFRLLLTQIPKFGIVLVLVVVLVLGALGFRDRKETDVLQLICSASLIAKRSGFSRTRTTTSTRTRLQFQSLLLNQSASCEVPHEL